MEVRFDAIKKEHVILKASDQNEFSMDRIDFLFRFVSRQNERTTKETTVVFPAH